MRWCERSYGRRIPSRPNNDRCGLSHGRSNRIPPLNSGRLPRSQIRSRSHGRRIADRSNSGRCVRSQIRSRSHGRRIADRSNSGRCVRSQMRSRSHGSRIGSKISLRSAHGESKESEKEFD